MTSTTSTFERRFKLLILLNVLVSMLGFGVANQSLALLVPALMLALTGWWVTEHRRHRGSWSGLPRALANVILVLMLLVAGLRAWLAESIVSGFTEFLAAVIVLKLWERRTARDYGQLITLSLFMTVGSTLTDNGLLTGAVWVIQLPLLVASVMMFQVYAARDRALALTRQSLPDIPPQPADLQRRPFLRLCAGVLLVAFMISSAVFVLVPRGTTLEEWTFIRSSQPRVAGFTDEVELGVGSLISDSYASVLELQINKGSNAPVATIAFHYLRGAVLESYSAGRWSEQPNRDPILSTALPGHWLSLVRNPPAPDDSNAAVIEQRITMLSQAREAMPLFSLYKPIAIQIPPGATVQGVKYDANSGWLQRDQPTKRLTQYDVRSRIPPADPSQVERRPSPPYPDERVQQIAYKILRDAEIDPDPATRPLLDDERAAHAFEAYLRGPNFAYTRDSAIKPPLGVDPTYWFLETRREGHCEYFASAVAGLCRSVGINARVVAGFIANEYDAARAVYIVRETDAHAWAEVDTGPNGWKVIDATPGAMALQERRDTFWDRYHRLAASINQWWATNIVTFGQAQQDKLLARIGASSITDTAVDVYRQSSRTVRRFVRNLRSPIFAATVAGSFALAAGAGWLLLRAWKRRPARPRHELGWAMRGREKSIYKATLSHLASRGHAKPNWSPPLVHLREVASHDPDLADRAQAIMHLLYESRFGGNPQRLAEARRLLSDLRALN